MSTMVSTGLAGGENGAEAASAALAEALQDLEGRPDLALVYSSSELDYDCVLKAVASELGDVPVVGCSTAGQFTERELGRKTVSVALMRSDSIVFSTAMARGLSGGQEAVVRSLAKAVPEVPEGHQLTAILLVDGLSGAGEELTVMAARVFEGFAGCPVRLVGGFAGDDLAFRGTEVFCGVEHAPDSAAVCFMVTPFPLFTSVWHGHTPLSGPLTVTSASGNVVREIDGINAWEVWRRETEPYLDRLGEELDIDDPVTITRLILGNFELGLAAGDEGRYKIRFPMKLEDDGSLVFTCAIPQGSVFRIMDGCDTDEQIAASRKAAGQAVRRAREAGYSRFSGAMVFECGLRMALLRERFIRSIEGYRETLPGTPLIGWETYGEIRMEPGGYSGFHNTTTVMMLIPEC
ncbi:MAG: FIST N-terminal domain-containing protein [Candidatus Fermentibacteraceae bacterium]